MSGKRSTAARTTLGDLHRATSWVWVYCEKCPHSSPLACAVAVIRWGPDTSSDRLRRCARCTACGHKGATIQHPGWGGSDIGFLPFPVDSIVGAGKGACEGDVLRSESGRRPDMLAVGPNPRS